MSNLAITAKIYHGDIKMSSKELVITDVKQGEGKETKRGALCVVQYEGFLEDGTKFDSSLDKGKLFQFVFGTGRVIKGWDQGLIGMREGGKRTLFVPSELGYGERQIGQFIKPHSNLIFHVELLEVRTRDD
jgi:peptidylprolyl isomerase